MLPQIIIETAILSPLVDEDIDCAGKQWRLWEPFRLQSVTLNGVLEVPKGFVTDFASIPQAVQNLITKNGPWDAGAVGHDWIYSNKGKIRVWQEWMQGWLELEIKREVADNFLLELMEFKCVDTFRKNAIYDAVRFFGSSHWKE